MNYKANDGLKKKENNGNNWRHDAAVRKAESDFDDCEKAVIGEREVIIDPQGKIKDKDLEKLVETLANVKAFPIRVIKN